MARYKHPFSATIGEEAHRRGLPNEMNYVMDYPPYSLSAQRASTGYGYTMQPNGRVSTELSEKSVLNKSMAVEIPDFIGGLEKYKY